MMFRDRTDAGRQLADELAHYAGASELLVLALSRGAIPVAAEVARELGAPLDVFLVTRVGVPGNEELTIGAVASGGVRIVSPSLQETLDVPTDVVNEVLNEESDGVAQREALLRGGRPAPDLGGRTLIVVDEGMDSGSAMREAVRALRQRDPVQLVVAVPVGARVLCEEVWNEVDEMLCLSMPEPFDSVSAAYEELLVVSDEEAQALMAAAAARAASRIARDD